MTITGLNITGTLINSYIHCMREAWLVSRHIMGNQEDDNLELGRFLQQNVYQRQKKEITVGHLKLDVMNSKEGKLVIGEVKKSSASYETAFVQLLFYLYELKMMGIEAIGELLFPEEKRKEKVILDENAIQRIERIKKEIYKLVIQEMPPKPIKIKRCKNCSFREFCWA